MNQMKRVLALSFYICCAVLSLAVLLGIFTPLRAIPAASAHPLAIVVVTLVALFTLVGAGCCLAKMVLRQRRSQDMLRIGDDGEISIETAALTSTVRQAVRGVEGVLLRDVEVGVAQQRSENVLEVRLVVEPGESCKLMSAARAMQEACKRSLESFTEHRVATVAVDYVQGPDSHRESAAKPSPDGGVDDDAVVEAGMPGCDGRHTTGCIERETAPDAVADRSDILCGADIAVEDADRDPSSAQNAS